MLHQLLSIRSASFRNKVCDAIAYERRFCCWGFFSFPRVRGDLFGFTRLTDGPDIHSDVLLTDMAMPFLSTQTY